MKKIAKQSLMVVIAAAMGLGASIANADGHMGKDRVYVIDGRGEVAKSGAGLCWRTGFWTPAAAANDPAGCACDKDLLPKETCEPKKAASAAPMAKPASSKVTLAADALFDFDKAVLRPEGKAKLDELVGKSKSLNLEVIIAVGHTDSIGSSAYNQALSVRRAEAVKAYLVSKGIESNRVYTEGKGETQAVADNATRAGRAKNRRVEVEVVGTRK